MSSDHLKAELSTNSQVAFGVRRLACRLDEQGDEVVEWCALHAAVRDENERLKAELEDEQRRPLESSYRRGQ